MKRKLSTVLSSRREGAVQAAWRIGLTLPEHALGALEAALEEQAAAISSTLVEDGGESDESSDCLWRLTAYCADAAQGRSLVALATEASAALGLVPLEIDSEAVPDEDWAAAYARNATLLFAGRFVVHGDHLHPPPGRIAIRINAGNAFGSGRHGSTRGCLLALDRIANQRRVTRALDLGTGSGVLAVAIAKSWDGGGMGSADVLAADIDPVAVTASRLAAEANGVATRVRARLSDGFAGDEIFGSAPYDLIAANILADPLRRMAPAMAEHLAPKGLAILSGLLGRQEEDVVEDYRRAGLRLSDRIRLGDWSTLLLIK